MSAILSSLLKDHPAGISDAINTAKEICQEIILSGLWRSNFFNHMAFHGGTALRIFYDIDRFSEDLDFCQIDDGPVDLATIGGFIEDEFESLGLEFHVSSRIRKESNITGYKVKGNASDTMIAFGFQKEILDALNPDAVISIKIDVDVDTPKGFGIDHKFKTYPFNYGTTLLDKPSLFAAKTSAVITRHWKNRIKGRDLYDFEWYIRNGTPINTVYLINNLQREGIVSDNDITRDELVEILRNRFDSIDYHSAIDDLYPFIDNKKIPQNWSSNHFNDMIEMMKFV